METRKTVWAVIAGLLVLLPACEQILGVNGQNPAHRRGHRRQRVHKHPVRDVGLFRGQQHNEHFLYVERLEHL